MRIGQIKHGDQKKIIVNINDTFYSNSKKYKLNVLDLIVSLKKDENLSKKVTRLIKNNKLVEVKSRSLILNKKLITKPVDAPEAWAVGVTYKRQALEHDKDLSKKSKKVDLYYYVYKNYRAEVFFKGLPRSIVGPNEKLYLRSDSKLIMPEPELVLIIGNNGLPIALTLGNDLTAWDIEKECPLYLNQAKIWSGSGSFGPWIIPIETIKDPYDLELSCKIIRNKKIVLKSSGSTKDLKRKFEELCHFMNLSNKVSAGSILYTGTACVIDHNFTLKKKDKVIIYNNKLGILENYIDLHKKEKKYIQKK